MTNLLPLDMPAYLEANIQPCRWEALSLFLTALKNNFPGSELLIIADFRVQNSLVVLHHLPADIVQCSQYLGALDTSPKYTKVIFFIFFFLLSVEGNITAMEQHTCYVLQWDWKREKEGRTDCVSWDQQSSLRVLNKISSPWPAWNYIRMGQLKSVNGPMPNTGEKPPPTTLDPVIWETFFFCF